MKNYSLILLFLLIVSVLNAQEIVSGLQVNNKVKQEHQKRLMESGVSLKSTEEVDPIVLPFFEDFKDNTVYPDQSKFSDYDAFINADFAYRSANLGVATLDALDSSGALHIDASTFPFLADELTSQKIRLDSIFSPNPKALSPSDSVYFSFYYQPQGRGNDPEAWDTLCLDFSYFTGDSILVDIDSADFIISELIPANDTILPGDTIYPPCNPDWWLISYDTIYYSDTEALRLPCDSIMEPELIWKRVWHSNGMTLDTFYAIDSAFYSRQVMIPILDSAGYYRNDFRFKFYNYASLASNNIPSWRSNADQWNIDYILLNTNRSVNNTSHRDISFVEKAPSMLKDYTAMPYNQYRVDPVGAIRTQFEMIISNLDADPYKTTYTYHLWNEDNSFTRDYDGGSCNLLPVYTDGYQDCVTCDKHACPPYTWLFPLGSEQDSASFYFMHIIKSDETPINPLADTLYFTQNFYNYYAYDDGTAELGYGLSPAESKLGYQFELNEADCLKAVDMYFNQTLNEANIQFFDLAVWKDNNGVPGEIIYTRPSYKPVYSDSLNHFYRYEFDSAIVVSNIFYVGWIQKTDDNLNVGLDTDQDRHEKIFFDTSGEWEQSQISGSLMIRPVFGNSDGCESAATKKSASSLEAYPNPNHNGMLQFNIPADFYDDMDTENAIIEIYNIFGQKVLRKRYQQELNISELSKGVYILNLINPLNNSVRTTKLVVAN